MTCNGLSFVSWAVLFVAFLKEQCAPKKPNTAVATAVNTGGELHCNFYGLYRWVCWVWLRLLAYGSLWLRNVAFGCVWLCMVVCGYVWLCVSIHVLVLVIVAVDVMIVVAVVFSFVFVVAVCFVTVLIIPFWPPCGCGRHGCCIWNVTVSVAVVAVLALEAACGLSDCCCKSLQFMLIFPCRMLECLAPLPFFSNWFDIFFHRRHAMINSKHFNSSFKSLFKPFPQTGNGPENAQW